MLPNSTTTVGGGAPPPPTPTDRSFSSPSSSSSSSLSLDSFTKDGRKICVGDCALFKPPQDSPPFIGIIRKVTVDKEDNFRLIVNWLYRPSDVKLAKGVFLEAAPNEVFYSFHKDEIPAASLLHRCRVSFLHKSGKLPSGIASFICRRVYDVENNCLWWLTAKDYINERQEEVDKLLNKTRLEMHGVAPSGGHSPKSSSGPTSANQLKPSLDTVNSASFPTQVKGKRREWSDQSTDSSKRRRLSKTEDGESGLLSSEQMLKSEIAKITEKGELVDFEGVEKLVKLMQSDNNDKTIDLAARTLLVDVIAVTDRFDCLAHFIQYGGLSVLDEWLQGFHKGKISDSGSTKENEKPVTEFLLAILRALDKLPVNLHALQTCNVGKSVNHLRTHKNFEIQKKSRSLVDTWKKRVEAEMNMNEAKSVSNRTTSWASKPVLSEASHGGNRKSGGSTEVGVRNTVAQSSAARNSQVKPGAVDSIAKSSPPPVSLKSLTMSSIGNLKEPSSRTAVGTGISDPSPTPVKEERTGSPSQSQTNSQSVSIDNAKTVISGEDSRSPAAGSAALSRNSVSVPRHQKSSNAANGSAVSVVQREPASGKIISSSRSSLSEKVSPTGVSQNKVPELPLDPGNNQRLIVRLPNTIRSPSRGTVVGSVAEEPADVSGKSSPAEKHDSDDSKDRRRNEVMPSDLTSSICPDLFQGNDVGANDGNLSRDECHKDNGDDDKLLVASKPAGLLSGVMPRKGKLYEASLSSINALVESCVKISQESECASPEDDTGMNLLASVATGEILKSDYISPSTSPRRKSAAAEEPATGNDLKVALTGEESSQNHCSSDDGAGPRDLSMSVDLLQAKNKFRHSAKPKPESFADDSKTTSVGSELKMGDGDAPFPASTCLQQVSGVPCLKSDELAGSASAVSFQVKNDTYMEADCVKNYEKFGLDNNLKMPSQIDECEEGDVGGVKTMKNTKTAVSELVVSFEKVVTRAAMGTSSETGDAETNAVDKIPSSGISAERKSPIAEAPRNSLVRGDEDVNIQSASADSAHVEPKAGRPDVNNVGLASSTADPERERAKSSDGEEDIDGCTSSSGSAVIRMEEAESTGMPGENQSNGAESGGLNQSHVLPINASQLATGSGVSVKLEFDLNEGFPADDGNQGELAKSVVPGVLSAVHIPCPLPIPISSMSGMFSTSITVAAAAKGPFLPPENLLRSKSELGWKGSAATSAFRPAEPRKNLDVALNSSTEIPSVETGTSKRGRLLLDFDLNVPDERVLEDVTASCSGSGSHDRGASGLDLDLNKVDESPDNGPVSGTFLSSYSARVGLPSITNGLPLPGGFSSSPLNVSRGFDLNNGPGLDEAGTETAPNAQAIKSTLPFASNLPSARMNMAEFGNFSSWFPPANSYTGLTIPSMFPGRGEQIYLAAPGPQRILAPPSTSNSFGPEMYRGHVLSSSPAPPFATATPFQYSGFAFETGIPSSSNALSSTSTAYVDPSPGGAVCFPAIHSQLVGPTGIVPSPYVRPSFLMSLPAGSNSISPDGRKWGGQLDLNTGPGGSEADTRDDKSRSVIQQHIFPGSQAMTEEQLKMYHMAAGIGSSSGLFKRKEPDGGRDANDRFGYSQASWK